MYPKCWHARAKQLAVLPYDGVIISAHHAGGTGDDEAGEEVQSKLPEAEQRQQEIQAIRLNMEKRQKKKALQKGAQARSAALLVPLCFLHYPA